MQFKKAERDAYRSRTRGKRRAAENGNRQHCKQEKSDQPEEATVKEQRVDDIVMDQGPRGAGVTKMRMDEMLMGVSNGTSRVCVDEEKVRASDNPRIARRSCQERSSKRNERL